MNSANARLNIELPVTRRDFRIDQPAPSRPVINMRQGSSGHWTLSDADDLRGGCFRDRISAMKFIRREFGEAAIIVIHSRSATLDAARRRVTTE